jgi:magnesium chelatase family protein
LSAGPCPCGWFGDPERACRCGETQRLRYWSRLSGPLLDRIDLQVVVRRLAADTLVASYGADNPQQSAESSAVVAVRVAAARERMVARNPSQCPNSQLSSGALQLESRLSPAGMKLWRQAIEKRNDCCGWLGRSLILMARQASSLATLPKLSPIGPSTSFRARREWPKGDPPLP